MDAQTRQAIVSLVRQLTDLQDKVTRVERAAGTSQLPNSSLTGGGIKAIDETGTHRGTVGFQDDGTFGTVAKNGPAPPAPSAPAVTAGQLSLSISWDGLFAVGDDGDPQTQPLDFDHVQVHLSTVSGFTPDATTLHGSLSGPGALVCSPLMDSTTYYVVLIGVNTSDVTGDPSVASSGVPEAVVATDVIDGIITTLKLADDAVTEAKIAAGAVGSTEIADDSVTTPKIVAGAIQTDKIAAGAIAAGSIASGAVTTDKLDALAVTSDKIAANAIIAGKIAAGAVTAASIAADAIDGKVISGATIRTITNAGGFFAYDGAPAMGNLIVSIASDQGTDAYGNSYPQGLNVAVGEIDGTTLNATTITAGSLSAGSVGDSALINCDTQDGTSENVDITFDTDGGRLLVYSTTRTTQTFTASGTFTVPAGVTSLTVECWAAGAGGAGGDLTSGGYGGGGGAYTKVNALVVTPGTNYAVTVGAGGSAGTANGLGSSGGASKFGTVCVANGGAAATSSRIGIGGSGSTSIGDVRFSGGNGGTASGTGGGGGGEGAASSSNGNPGGNNTGSGSASGGSNTAGGNGGAGGAANQYGGDGLVPGGGGGGGGGGSSGSFGGSGARGQVKVTYTTAIRIIASIAPTAGTDASGNSYPQGISGIGGQAAVSNSMSLQPGFATTGQFVEFTSAQWTPLSIVCPPSETILIGTRINGYNNNTTSSTIAVAPEIKVGSTVIQGASLSRGPFIVLGSTTLTNNIQDFVQAVIGQDVLAGRAGQTITIVPCWRISSGGFATSNIAAAGIYAIPSLYTSAVSSS